METITTITSIVQIIGISLGVGSSTLAVLNFFNAIADGTIDPVERRMMGVTYIVLRVAMVLILASTTLLIVMGVREFGYDYFTPYVIAQCVLIVVLFVNAALMTARIMPSSCGPAIQAGSWYLLGFGLALYTLGLADFSIPLFIVAYAIELAFAYFLINSVMHYQRYKLAKTQGSSK
jgi:hypothetical protein